MIMFVFNKVISNFFGPESERLDLNMSGESEEQLANEEDAVPVVSRVKYIQYKNCKVKLLLSLEISARSII